MRIEQLNKNKYRVYAELGTNYKGDRVRKSCTISAKSKRELKAKIDEWLASLDAATTDDYSLTVGEMVAAVWSTVTRGKSPNTVKGYEVSRERITSMIGALKASQLQPRTLQAWVDDMAQTNSARTGRPPSAKTIRDTYSVLRLCCQTAVAWELLKKNPCHDVALPTKARREVKTMTPEEFNAFCAGLDALDLDTRVLFELALFCGLRRGEIMAIKEKDADGNKLTINAARYQLDGENIEKETKTSAGERVVTLPRFVVDDIKRLKTDHKKKRLKYGELWKRSPYLLKAHDGAPFHPQEANKRLRRYMVSIGLSPINFHALRHTYASICVNSGLDIADVSKRLGHSNPSTTLAIYTHLFADDRRDPIADKLDEMIRKA